MICNRPAKTVWTNEDSGYASSAAISSVLMISGTDRHWEIRALNAQRAAAQGPGRS